MQLVFNSVRTIPPYLIIHIIRNLYVFQINGAGPPEEDDEYVMEINELNLVWKVDSQNCELVPLESGWGTVPRYELLEEDDARVLVFDFGTELYVWNGKNASFHERKIGLKLAKDLWDNEEKNKELIVKNHHPLFRNDFSNASGSRPSWALLGKVNQNGETILFREKFSGN